MEERPIMSCPAVSPSMRYQPLTPVSPGLATSMPLVCDPIPPLPMTPPDADDIPDKVADKAALSTALQVIAAERDALTYLWQLYDSDPIAQDGFTRAVSTISNTTSRGGKLVVSGVGKSGKIGQKVVATMNSFGIRSAFLHPTEALHGDLGMVGEHDTILVLTYSGRTSELLALISHLPSALPLIAITSHTHPSTCPLFHTRPSFLSILLPAPIPTSETDSFGLPAPTTSTTTALALSDALALAVVRRIHPSPASAFHSYHPGGAIGATAAAAPTRMSDIATLVADVPIARPRSGLTVTALDILLTAATSPSGWVRLSSSTIVSPRSIQTLSPSSLSTNKNNSNISLDHPAAHLLNAIEKTDWISVPSTSSVSEVRDWIREMRSGERGRTFLKRGTVLGIVDPWGVVSAVVMIEDVVGEGGVD